MNSIDVADLTYPEKPDNDGRARRYYKRRAYYFGQHNSPESFLLFGEWKRRLMESGEAPEVKEIRRDLAHSAKPGTGSLKRSRYRRGILVTLVLCVTILGISQIVSSFATPSVDGKPLTLDEQDLVRGVRKHKDRIEALTLGESRPSRIVRQLTQLMEEGPGNARHEQRNGT